MGRTKTATWIAGTAFLALVMLALAWMLAVSPRLDAAAEMQDQAEAEQSRIDILEIELATLRRDFENIEEFRTELAALREKVPAAVDLPTLTRQVDTLAAEAGIVVTGMGATTPMPLTLAAPEPTAPPATDDAGGAEQPTTASAPATPPAPTTSAFYVVPLQITTLGDYEPTMAFFRALQEENPRTVLLADLEATSQDAEGSTNGLPAVLDGALEVRITAYAIVLPDPDAGVPVDGEEPAESEGELPVPTDQPNPFTTLTTGRGTAIAVDPENVTVG